jgi:hypothetical protein
VWKDMSHMESLLACAHPYHLFCTHISPDSAIWQLLCTFFRRAII